MSSPNPPSRRGRVFRWTGAALGVAALLGLAAWLVVRPGLAEKSTEASPTLPSVATQTAEARSSYPVSWSFVGQLRPVRQSAVGFDLAGTLASVEVEEGDVVAVDQPLARLDTARLEARRRELEARLRQAEAELELTAITRKRTRRAFEAKAATEQERDEAEQAYAAADAAVASARAMLDVVDVDVKKSQLTAPFDAEVLQRMADEGRVLAAGTPVLTLMDNRPPEARIGVSGPLVARLEPGQAYELHVEGQPHPARLTAVLRDRSTQTRTVDAVFQLQGHPPGWSAGDLVTLTQARELDQPNHRLPKTALTRGVRGLWACLVAVPDGDGGHVLERRELELLHQADGWVYVIGTLIDGERVVTGGLHKLAPGMSVRLSGSADGLAPAAPGDPS